MSKVLEKRIDKTTALIRESFNHLDEDKAPTNGEVRDMFIAVLENLKEEFGI